MKITVNLNNGPNSFEFHDYKENLSISNSTYAFKKEEEKKMYSKISEVEFFLKNQIPTGILQKIDEHYHEDNKELQMIISLFYFSNEPHQWSAEIKICAPEGCNYFSKTGNNENYSLEPHDIQEELEKISKEFEFFCEDKLLDEQFGYFTKKL
ncbi:MAG: hypothetical protein WC099_00345 [Candidatus Paceibacterota bacterium]